MTILWQLQRFIIRSITATGIKNEFVLQFYGNYDLITIGTIQTLVVTVQLSVFELHSKN